MSHPYDSALRERPVGVFEFVCDCGFRLGGLSWDQAQALVLRHGSDGVAYILSKRGLGKGRTQ